MSVRASQKPKLGPSGLRKVVAASRKRSKSISSSGSWKIQNRNAIYDKETNPIGFTLLEDGMGKPQQLHSIKRNRTYGKNGIAKLLQKNANAVNEIEEENTKIKKASGLNGGRRRRKTRKLRRRKN